MKKFNELVKELNLTNKKLEKVIYDISIDTDWIICHHISNSGGMFSIWKEEDVNSTATMVNLSGEVIKQGLRTLEEIQPILDALNAAEVE